MRKKKEFSNRYLLVMRKKNPKCKEMELELRNADRNIYFGLFWMKNDSKY